MPSSVFRRFASDGADAQKEEPVSIDSASGTAETATTYAGEAAESSTNNYEQAKESVTEAAAAAASAVGFSSSQPQRSSGYSSPNAFSTRPLAADRALTPSTGIYVGNLLFDVTANDLTKEFSPFGTIKSAIIASDARGLSKG